MQATSRTRLLLLVAVLAAIAFALSLAMREDEQPPLPYEEHRRPVSNPPVDPNRPDLFEEPVIDEPEP